MKAYPSIRINGTKEEIWSIISDLENSEKYISSILMIEVIDRPNKDILGFKWRETRVMFRKEATEVMWVTDFEENAYYRTRAESHGAIYISTLTIEEKEDHCILSMGFEGEAVSILAKLSSVFFGKMMMKSTEKALHNDLEDIKKIVEKL
jgi:hypothetical protein